MRKSINIVLGFTLILCLISCTKEKNIQVQTVIKGNVSDLARGIKVSGYKITLWRGWTRCGDWRCGPAIDTVASSYTDNNGDYAIIANHKPEPGDIFGLEEQNFGNPYCAEYLTSKEIVAGKTHIVNINAWRPIDLKLNLEVLNNNNPPLMVRNQLAGSNTTLLNAENIYEQTIKRTYNLRTKPYSEINIIFWYYTGGNAAPVLHQKIIPYRTSLDNVITLDYTIDCSTF